MDIMSVLDGAPPRKQKPTTGLMPELAEPSPVILPPAPVKQAADEPMPGLRVTAPIRPMAHRFTAVTVGLPGSAPRAPKRSAEGTKTAAAAEGSCTDSRPVVGGHPPPVRPPAMASATRTAISASPRVQEYEPRPTPDPRTTSEGAMVGLLLDFWSGPGTRDSARPATPPLEEFSPKMEPSEMDPAETIHPEFGDPSFIDRDTPRRGPKSMAKLKNSRCTVRPERQRIGRPITDEDSDTGADKRARTDKLALGAIYAHLYERVPFTNASEQNLARIFSDKELRVLMGMNKMTINNYNSGTKKYTEKTKQDKVREIIPVIKKGGLVVPREHAQFPAARLRHTDNPAAIARRKATEAGKHGKKRRMSSAELDRSSGAESAALLRSKATHFSHSRKRPRIAITGKTTALILGKRPTVTDELSKFRDVSLDTLKEQQLVEVRSANGRSWIKAQITGIEESPLDADSNPIIPPVISVRCTVPRKRREDGKPHVVQWRGCSQDQAGSLVFKQAAPTGQSGQKSSGNSGARGVVVALPANISRSSSGSSGGSSSGGSSSASSKNNDRGRRERKIPMRYRGVEWTDMANILMEGENSDSDDQVTSSASDDDDVQTSNGASASARNAQHYVEEEEEESEESWLLRQQHYNITLTREQHRQGQIRQRNQERENRERQRRKQAEHQQLLLQQRRQRQRERLRQRQPQPQPAQSQPQPRQPSLQLQLAQQQQAHTGLRGAFIQSQLAGPMMAASNGLTSGPIRPSPMPLHPDVAPSEMQMRPEVARVRGSSNATTGTVQDSPTGHRRQWQALPKTIVTTMPGAGGASRVEVQFSPQAMAF